MFANLVFKVILDLIVIFVDLFVVLMFTFVFLGIGEEIS